MTDWKKVTGTQPERPEEIDRTSSPSTVYLRKNIEQVEKEVEGADGKIQTVTEWQYDEKEMTVARVISFEAFSMMVDEALERMKKMLENNKAMQTLVSGEAGETVEKDM